MTAFRAGLDLGQVSDWTALVIVEYGEVEGKNVYAVRHLQRWRGTPYPALIGEVAEILSRPELSPKLQKLRWANLDVRRCAERVGTNLGIRRSRTT